jgi:hypothetical protein
MEKFNLTVRVSDLKVGQVFWFAARWHKVAKIDGKYVYYKLWSEERQTASGKNDTIMRGSKMLVQIKEDKNE